MMLYNSSYPTSDPTRRSWFDELSGSLSDSLPELASGIMPVETKTLSNYYLLNLSSDFVCGLGLVHGEFVVVAEWVLSIPWLGR